MSHEFDDWRQADDGDAVVTYTRVSGRRRPKRAARPRPERAPDAVLDAAELHRAEPGERVGFDSAPHQVGAADIEDFVADRRPPKRRSFGMVGGALALVAGAAILATTVGLATILPGGSGQDSASSESAPAFGSSNGESEVAMADATVRKIPLPGGPPEEAWRVESKPPIPRPRPDDVVARADPETAASATPAEPASPAIETPEAPAPQSTVPGTASVPVLEPPVAAPAPTAAAPENSATDGLISSIEETLARIDESTPSAAAGKTIATSQQPLPAQAAPPPLAPAAPPPVVMTQPAHPAPSDVLPPPDDILPPPAAMGGYGGYAIGPTPPEPVPEAYPQALPVLPDGQVYPQNPNSYPADSYVFPPETAEETEVRRRGLLGRTLAKATGAVGRVFERN